MTANQMGDAVELLYEGAAVTNRQFNSREKSYYLNSAIKRFVDTRMFPDGNIKGKGFEADAKRILDLSPLLSTTTVVYLKENNDFVRGTYKNGCLRNQDKDNEGITNNGSSNTYGTVSEAEDMKYGVLVELPNDVLYIVTENCDTIIGSGTNRKWRYNVKVAEIPNGNYIDNVYNSFKNPNFDLVWRREYGSSVPSSLTRNTNDFRSSNSARVANDATIISPAINATYDFKGLNKRIVQLIPSKNWDIAKYNVFYIREPRTVVVDYNNPTNAVDCDLHPHVHQEICELAVSLMVASIIPANQKYQVTENEVKKSE